MKQNYLNIFENVDGEIVIAYASCGDDNMTMGEITSVVIEKDDLYLIGRTLMDLHNDLDQGS